MDCSMALAAVIAAVNCGLARPAREAPGGEVVEMRRHGNNPVFGHGGWPDAARGPIESAAFRCVQFSDGEKQALAHSLSRGRDGSAQFKWMPVLGTPVAESSWVPSSLAVERRGGRSGIAVWSAKAEAVHGFSARRSRRAREANTTRQYAEASKAAREPGPKAKAGSRCGGYRRTLPRATPSAAAAAAIGFQLAR